MQDERAARVHVVVSRFAGTMLPTKRTKIGPRASHGVPEETSRSWIQILLSYHRDFHARAVLGIVNMFDTERMEIAASVQKAVSGHVFLCTLAQHIGNGATASILEKIVHTHFASKVGLAAATALAGLEPAAAHADVWRSMLSDKDELIRRAAADALAGPAAQRQTS